MFIPWHLKPGLRYDESVAKAEAETGDEFQSHMKALCRQIRYAGYSLTPVLDAEHCVAEVRDAANGYTLSIYVTFDRADWIAWLELVEVGPLDPEEEVW